MFIITEANYCKHGCCYSQTFQWYEGPVAECKGEGTAKDQLKRSNDIQDKSLARQNAIMDQIQSAMAPYLTGSTGFDPQQLALMRSHFLDQNASQYNQAGKAVAGMLRARGAAGGADPVGGDYVRGVAALRGGQASDRASGLRGIDLSNLSQMLTNRFNAGSLMSGNAATLNAPIGVSGSMSSNALNQYMQASNSGFGASFMRSLGGSLGQGLGTMATGGISKLAGGFTFNP